MNGSRPKPPRPKSVLPKPPKASRRHRDSAALPLLSLSVLFVVHLVMGLLMSVPSPPYWVWIAVAIAVPLIAFGVTRPVAVAGKTDRGDLLAYIGGLVMAVALAVSVNYIGSENSFEDVRFFTAVAALAGLCLLAVVLTAIAAIASANVGTQLISRLSYGRSVATVMLLSFLGLFVGGMIGLFTLPLGAVVAYAVVA